MSTLTSMFSSAPYARLRARAMMSPTTSLGRPFSAESCARPVTSSRFMPALPLFNFGDKKSGVDPLSEAPAAPGDRPGAVKEIVPKREKRRRWLPRLGLRQVVSDVRELVRELVLHEDHRDDDRDRDDCNDECVLDQ